MLLPDLAQSNRNILWATDVILSVSGKNFLKIKNKRFVAIQQKLT